MAIQLIDILQRLHDQGFIHCDLKTDNIMIGNYTKEPKSMNKLYLIDFGISQSYLTESGTHIAFEKDVPFKGNVIFSSKNAFDQKTLSRRDDIISLMYLLVFCVNSNQSWIDNMKPISDQFEQIGKYKISTKAKDFVTQQTKFFYPLLKYAYRLEFEERPDYEKMKFMLKKILLERSFIPDNKFDWSLGPGQSFQRINKQSRHSSISSCDLKSQEANLQEDLPTNEKLINLKKFKYNYHSEKPLNESRFKLATHTKIEKEAMAIPANFKKIGEY